MPMIVVASVENGSQFTVFNDGMLQAGYRTGEKFLGTITTKGEWKGPCVLETRGTKVEASNCVVSKAGRARLMKSSTTITLPGGKVVRGDLQVELDVPAKKRTSTLWGWKKGELTEKSGQKWSVKLIPGQPLEMRRLQDGEDICDAAAGSKHVSFAEPASQSMQGLAKPKKRGFLGKLFHRAKCGGAERATSSQGNRHSSKSKSKDSKKKETNHQFPMGSGATSMTLNGRTYHSNGVTSFGLNGRTYHSNGHTSFASNGITYHSNGHTSRSLNGRTYHSDGTTSFSLNGRSYTC